MPSPNSLLFVNPSSLQHLPLPHAALTHKGRNTHARAYGLTQHAQKTVSTTSPKRCATNNAQYCH
eukprot:2405108-Amphidinium_carterae.2